MSPSHEHEAIKSMIGRLVEAFCLERGIDFRIYGNWTLQAAGVEKALEPDECYVFGPATAPILSKEAAPIRPDLAIEVIWTSGGISKLDIYRAIGVREVWFWQRGIITPRELRDGDYVEIDASQVLPGIDLVQLVSFLDRPTMSAAIRDYRDALRG
jgi:Uma2 family endonuclease